MGSNSKHDSEELKRKLLDMLPENAVAAPMVEQATAGGVENLSTLSVRELKQRICNMGVELPTGIAEKSELVDFLRNLLASREDSSNPNIPTTEADAGDPNKRCRFI